MIQAVKARTTMVARQRYHNSTRTVKEECEADLQLAVEEAYRGEPGRDHT